MRQLLLFLMLFFVLSLNAQENKHELSENSLREMGERIAARHDSLLNSIRLRKINGLPRPTVGYALSGGGAKGLAHIGSIEVLESIGLYPDKIAGTSMGSIVGALYAVGYSAKDMTRIADSINWDVILFDRMQRTDFAIEEKNLAEAYLLKFGFDGFKLQVPTGMLSGQRLGVMLGGLLWPSHDIRDFSQLSIPFRAVALDVMTGETISLGTGDLVDAVRASMAIPTAFTAMEIDGRLLVDGGVAQNFPIKEVKELGSDIVIGFDVGGILYERKKLTSALAIMDQITSLQVVESAIEQENDCNVYIRPELGELSAADFNKADTLMTLGRLAAEAQRPFLQQLKDSLEKYYPQPEVRPFMPVQKRVMVKEIEFKGLSRISEGLASSRLRLRADRALTIKEIEKAIDRLYGTQFFKKIDYRVEGLGKDSKLVIRVEEASYATIRFALHADNVYKTGILVNYTVRNFRKQGSRIMLTGRFGENPGMNLSYRFFIARQVRMSGNFEAAFQYIELPIYRRTEDKLIKHYQDFTDFRVKFDAERSFTNNFKYGIGGHFRSSRVDVNHLTEYDLSDARIGAHQFLHIDTYDRAFFPNKGERFYGEVNYNFLFKRASNRDLSETYWTGLATFDKVWPIASRVVLRTNFNAGWTSESNTPLLDRFALGARTVFEQQIVPFAGAHYGDKISPNLLSGQGKIRFEPWKDKFVYLNANYAMFSPRAEDIIKFEDTIWGYGVGIGFLSILGPVFMEFGKSSDYNDLVWSANVGFVF